MNDLKTRRVEKFSKIGFWLVCMFFFLQIVAYVLMGVIYGYLKMKNLIPADCTTGNALNNFLLIFSNLISQPLRIIIGSYFVSVVGFVVSLGVFFAGRHQQIARKQATTSIILFVAITVFSVFIYWNFSETGQKSYIAATTSEFSRIRIEAEIFRDNNGGYGPWTDVCDQENTIFTSNRISKIIQSLRENKRLGEIRCHASGDSYIISAELFGDGKICRAKKIVCVDSNSGLNFDLKKLETGPICPNLVK